MNWENVDLHVFVPHADSKLSGRLKVDAAKTLLTVFSEDPVVELPAYIECVGESGQSISLLDCVRWGGGTASTYGQAVHSCQAFPHYVLIGGLHCTADEETIGAIYFSLSGAETLFWDISPWLRISNSSLDESILVEDKAPTVFGFVGSGEIFASQTDLGRIAAYHTPTFTGPSMSGFQARNLVTICIEPVEPVSVRTTIDYIYRFKSFAEICSGRTQGISDISLLSTKRINDHCATLDMSISHNSPVDPSEKFETQYDMLAAPSLGRNNFEALVSSWFSVNDIKRRVTYSRLSANVKQENFYDANRLVNATSLFEWFDSTKRTELPAEIEAIVGEFIRDIDELPESDERGRLLSMLGHVGAETLQTKMLRQLEQIIEELDKSDLLHKADFELVVTWIVKCRNMIVHGSGNKKVERVFDRHHAFLTETLEVMFAFLALQTAGWNIGDRLTQRFDRYGKYGAYLQSFSGSIDRLKADIEQVSR